MSKRKGLPRAAQLAAGCTLLAVALAAGTLSLAVNVSYGLQAGLALAIAYGLSDVAKLALPVCAAGLGWSPFARIVAVAASLVSVWCACNYFLDYEGQRLLEARHQSAQVASTAADAERWRAELATLGSAGDEDVLSKRADQLAKAIADEAADGGCGPQCRSLQRERDGVLADLAKAKRKAELERRLASARKALASSPPAEVSGLASVLAVSAGVHKDRAAVLISASRALLALVLIELLAHLSGAGARLIGAAMKPRRRRKAKPAADVVALDRGRRGLRSPAGV